MAFAQQISQLEKKKGFSYYQHTSWLGQ